MSGSMKADELPRRRLQMLEQTVSVRIDSEAWLRTGRTGAGASGGSAARARLEQAVLAVPATSPARDGSLGLDALRTIVLDPAYQLK